MLLTRLWPIAAPMLAAVAVGASSANTVVGAGATFPAPVYAKWAEAYRAATGISVNYQAIGSGGGIKQVSAGTIAFGASDKPLAPRDLAAAGLYQFPTLIGGVTPIVNLPGARAGELRLTGAVLADIYMGNVRRWNAPPIAALNPGLRLPNLPIVVVHRSDGSGTTFLFTTYLAGKSRSWAHAVGASDSVAWPTGQGGKGNDGVSAFVRQTIGAIGYVEYSFARQSRAAVVALRNSAGRFVSPGADSFAAAAGSADWLHSPGNHTLLIDEPAQAAWPITGATFILVPRRPKRVADVAQSLRFFAWAFRNGDAEATKLNFVPVPTKVEDLLIQQWSRLILAGGRPVYTEH